MTSDLALFGGPPAVQAPPPHFAWPPPMPELGSVLASYVDGGGPLSIVGRAGVFEQLEDRFCELVDRRFGLLCSSGTMALYSAFFALGLQPGDEVVSTVYSFHATATPLLHLGARVVLCDVEPDTGNIDPDALAELVGPQTRAVVTNHMWGHPVDVDRIRALTTDRGLPWVEDCSHAHFAEHRGRRVGGFGTIAVFSLQGNKLVTGGEGGILLTDDRGLYERATLIGHGMKRAKETVQDPALTPIARTGYGLKLRMHPLAALTALHILDRHCFRWIRERGELLDHFGARLAETGLVQPPARRAYVTSMGAHYGFKPRIDFAALGVPRDRLIEALRAEGLDVSIPGSRPFHQLPLFDADRFHVSGFDKVDHRGRTFPGADVYYGSIVSLPTFTDPSDRPLVDAYAEAFAKVLGRREELR